MKKCKHETNKDAGVERGVILRGMPHDDASLLRHQLMMGDVTVLPEDRGRLEQEVARGEGLDGLERKGIIR